MGLAGVHEWDVVGYAVGGERVQSSKGPPTALKYVTMLVDHMSTLCCFIIVPVFLFQPNESVGVELVLPLHEVFFPIHLYGCGSMPGPMLGVLYDRA